LPYGKERGEMGLATTRRYSTEQLAKRMAEWRFNNPCTWLRQQLKKYGVTVEWYLRRLKLQNNVCAICGKPETNTRNGKIKRLSVDHNHQTNRARALLCQSCNTRIGVLEDLGWVAKAREYLSATYGSLSEIVLTDADYVAAGL
jgi:hypothetical protein